MASQKTYRILLINEAQPDTDALKSLLDQQADLTICGQVKATSNTLTAIKTTSPHLAILESYMPDDAPVELCRSILDQYPSLNLILVTFYHNTYLLEVARQAGFRSYVARDRNPGEVMRSIRTVLSGQPYFNLEAMQTYNYEGDEYTRRLSLTFREIEYIGLIRQGLPMQEISLHLLVEPESIRMYHRYIYEKLGINNDADLVQFAIRHGL